MTATTKSASALGRLARHYGVQSSYVDLDKKRRTASPEALTSVLAALGAPVNSPGDATRALREIAASSARLSVPPVIVASAGNELVVRLPHGHAPRATSVRVRATMESGETASARVPVSGDELRVHGRWDIGYHAIEIESGRQSTRAHVLIAPRRCHRTSGPGQWGTFLPLYALRMRGDWGAGDFTGLRALLEWSGSLGASVVGTLPLLPQFLADPCDPSPYSPVSRLFWNEFFIDPAATAEWELSRSAQRIAAKHRAATWTARRSRLIDYRQLMRIKRDVLEALAAACFANPAQRAKLDRFLRERPQVVDYAQFRAACERHGLPWSNWPARMRDGQLRARDFDDGTFRYHAYVQWIAELQILGAAARTSSEHRGLYLDLPLGVNPAGYDTWRERDAFLSGLSAGAPPDPFFTKGQKWGLPPLDPHGLRAQGYRHFAACLRHHLRHAALLRIDHIMGFHRIFCVPQDMDATEGVYVQYPAEEFYAVLKIESHRAQCAVAGEDLGTVPERVRTSMRRHGVGRLYVMQFSFDGKRVATPPPGSVASLNTHDMAPFAAFYRGEDIDYRVDLGLMTRAEANAETRGRAGMRKALSAFLRKEGLLGRGKKPATAGAAMRALLRFLAERPAQTVLVNLEDLWLETEQQNTPGTTSERENWKRRAAKSFEEFSKDRAVLKILREIDGMRKERMVS